MPQAPPPEAPFADKLAYYRTQHTSKGVKAAHLFGTPIMTGRPATVGERAMQIIGHRLFEKNLPSTHKGWITYQLLGVIHVCEQYGEMLARRSQHKAGLR